MLNPHLFIFVNCIECNSFTQYSNKQKCPNFRQDLLLFFQQRTDSEMSTWSVFLQLCIFLSAFFRFRKFVHSRQSFICSALICICKYSSDIIKQKKEKKNRTDQTAVSMTTEVLDFEAVKDHHFFLYVEFVHLTKLSQI